MLQESREGTWIYIIDTIVKKLMYHIAELNEKYETKNGVVENIKQDIKQRWDNCGAFRIIRFERHKEIFHVQ